MSERASPMAGAGWILALGASTFSPRPETSDFHAIYSGDAFGNAGRGIVAIVARGIGSGRSGAEAAQIAIHSLVEGYFGAAATLGVGRAASLALSSVNAWMHGQTSGEPGRASMAAALSALIFVGKQVRLIHIGDCRIYRKRGGDLVPLTTEHARRLPDGTHQLTRSVGGDAEMHTEYSEDSAEIGDRYIVLSRGSYAASTVAQLGELLLSELPPQALAERVTDTVRRIAANADEATAIVIDVVERPDASFDDLAAAFAKLPLRRPPQEGENWDGFVVGRTLYRSRYTILKLAHDTVEDRDVVLKIPLPFMLQDQIFRAGFLREAWVGVTVRSPWIARYIDLPIERRSSLYIVMPYYRGETLEDRLRRPPRIPLLEGVGIAFKLCAAVGDLATLQIVHRDLKPDNIILLRDGEVRLLDLGLAYLPGIDDPGDERLGGTTRYMAPELFRGGAADQRSEVFSLGVTIYRMFAGGAFPFGQREATPLSRQRPDLPNWLGQCLVRAIAVEPEKRFSSVAEFADALENGLNRASGSPAVSRSSRYRFDAVRLWQGLALFFAVGFLVLLLLLLGHEHR